MLAIKPDDLDHVLIYPYANTEYEAALQQRFTIMRGKIYSNGNEWTSERMEQEKERVLELETAFKVAQMVVEAERDSLSLTE